MQGTRSVQGTEENHLWLEHCKAGGKCCYAAKKEETKRIFAQCTLGLSPQVLCFLQVSGRRQGKITAEKPHNEKKTLP